MKALCSDLREEVEALEQLVAGLSADQWKMTTPFLGWSVYDQVAHIAFIDSQAYMAATDRDALMAGVREISKVLARGESMPRAVDRLMGGPLAPQELLSFWREIREKLLAAFEVMDPKERLPWYGPEMSARSFITARLMETWAHGQNIYDALGVTRVNTDRLKHIAHMGVGTFAWSFVNRGLTPPEAAVRVELTSPTGQLWEWGQPDAVNRVTGAAEDFCLVVTTRRNPVDTGLVCEGEAARKWMDIAQCFAGPALDAPAPCTGR
jgi:uncharacterized protein (TIGR03084 family)